MYKVYAFYHDQGMVAVQVGGFHQSLVITTTVLPPKKLLQANHLMSLFSPWIMPFQWYTWGRYVLQIFLLICFLFLLQFYLLPHASINTWRKNETVDRFILLSFCGFDFFSFFCSSASYCSTALRKPFGAGRRWNCSHKTAS